jgi:hypothetical protein
MFNREFIDKINKDILAGPKANDGPSVGNADIIKNTIDEAKIQQVIYKKEWGGQAPSLSIEHTDQSNIPELPGKGGKKKGKSSGSQSGKGGNNGGKRGGNNNPGSSSTGNHNGSANNNNSYSNSRITIELLLFTLVLSLFVLLVLPLFGKIALLFPIVSKIANISYLF